MSVSRCKAGFSLRAALAALVYPALASATDSYIGSSLSTPVIENSRLIRAEAPATRKSAPDFFT